MSEKCHSLLLGNNGKPLAQVASVSAEFVDQYFIPEHYHPEDQLIFASRGVMTVGTEQGIWVVPPLRAVWIPVGTRHSVGMSGSVSMRTLYFLPGVVHARISRCFVMNVPALLRELIIYACQFPKLRRNVAEQKSLIDLIVTQVRAANSVPLQLPQPLDPRATKVAQILLANPSDERRLETLCKNCGASKRTIQRIFISETKMTFGKWRQQLRLLHALQLLASGEKVSAAALEAGYNSTSAFIAMFKAQLGATPTNYFKS